MNNTACPPVPLVPQSMQGLSPCALLQELQVSYLHIASGDKRKLVRHGERWSEYHSANPKILERAIVALFKQCPGAQDITGLSQRGGATQAGPYYRRAANIPFNRSK